MDDLIKIMCINDFYTFIQGKSYYYKESDKRDAYNLYSLDDYIYICGVSKVGFSLYFMTLSEYRENRIKEILND